ncbi:microcystin LR degradation protein MlrC [Tritrichomonas foetus]|uniref:Microcystin LR degradation protein MlrC n=1 Tax=Tritrichomonas foetus TaxID=1144522 RepID=A0A1J4KGG4_9EUKA|nr:microcystin LR degradation protein MlrC [Tritrichomonas foetus]|eukprot:OHT10465.1 microcystin LR degradation protein MlrC [Tritrichomonas foetus]
MSFTKFIKTPQILFIILYHISLPLYLNSLSPHFKFFSHSKQMKRIVIGGFHHESNTFNPIIADNNDIYVWRGSEFYDHMTDNSISGIITQLRKYNYDIIPTVLARAVPNGVWNKDIYLSLKEEFLTTLKTCGHVDGFCLALHGSMRVDQIGKAETDILTAIREIYPDLPIYASLDMHGTVTPEMARLVNGYVGYKTAPHIDEFETGEHAARMLHMALEEGVKTCMAICQVPFLIAGEQSETSVEPMVKLMKEIAESEKKPGVLASSYLLGYPWADSPENGVTAVVVTDGSQELADSEALRLGKLFWDTRREFHFYNDTRLPDETLKAALEFQRTEFPVVISDSGDNPTAGSSQDVTNFLKLILNDPEAPKLSPPLVYQGFYDPEVVKKAVAAGVGASFETDLGAAFDKVKSTPVHSRVTVKSVVLQWEQAFKTDMVLLDVQGVDVIVTSKHVGMYDPEMMRALGVVPEERKIIVVKLGYLEPELRKLAKRSIMALTDGSTNELLESIPYKHVKRPIFPLDKDFEAELTVFHA